MAKRTPPASGPAPQPPRSPARKTDDEPGAPPSLDWRQVHLWQIQPVRDVLVVLVVIGLLVLGAKLSIVTVPILLALGLAYLFEPVVKRATGRFKWLSRSGAAAAIIALTTLLVVVPAGLAVGFAAVQAVDFAGSISGRIDETMRAARIEDPARRAAAIEALPSEFWRRAAEAVHESEAADAPPAEGDEGTGENGPEVGPPAPEEAAGDAPKQEDPAAAEARAEEDDTVLAPRPADPRARAREEAAEVAALPVMAMEWAKRNAETLVKRAFSTAPVALTAVIAALGSMVLFAFGLFLTAFFFFFFCTSYPAVQRFLMKLIPDDKRARAGELLTKMDRVINGFVRGRVTIAFIQMAVLSLGYWLIGVPVPFIIGAIVGLLSIVPYVGLIGIPVSIIAILLDPPGMEWQTAWWWMLGAPVALYFLVQSLDDYVLTPAIQGQTTGMDTPAILFASLAGGALGGFFGVLLAIPVAACLKILLQDVFWPRFRAWAEGRARDFLPIGRT